MPKLFKVNSQNARIAECIQAEREKRNNIIKLCLMNHVTFGKDIAKNLQENGLHVPARGTLMQWIRFNQEELDV